jgi:3-phosphoshikimate 1-carboxyvinyltransferase
MHERPQGALFAALRELGYRVSSPNDKLPALIEGNGPRSGACRVSIAESSQFASALLLAARVGRWRVEVLGSNPEESPYITMTSKLIAAFPAAGGVFQIEPDASSGSYFRAADMLAARMPGQGGRGASHPSITVAHWPVSGWQVDQRFGEVLSRLTESSAGPPGPRSISRERDLGDSIMTAIVLAPFLTEAVTFTELGRLRLQECERVSALRTELTRCGAKVVEEGDTLTIYPSPLHGAEIETYGDHRMAMCFAILGLKVPGIKLKNPSCVKKTFPNFFQKLAAPPPHGLGVTVRDARTGRSLGAAELFAD